MPGVLGIGQQSAERRVPHGLPALLCPAGGQCQAAARAAGGASGGYRAASFPDGVPAVWSGRYFGVRPPDSDETPLSTAEVEFAFRRGLL